MSASEINVVLERQLLLQLGERLKRLRKAQGIGTVEMAARVGVTRNTLRSVEAGDPAPSMGTYLRVMSVLGISGELALLTGEAQQPASADSVVEVQPRDTAPVGQVRIAANTTRHRLQDLQSLVLHQEAVRLAKGNPALVLQAQETVERWLNKGDSRSAQLWREWQSILADRAWKKVLSHTGHAQQLRQASPLVTVLPEETRQRILKQVIAVREGVVLNLGS